MTAHFNDSSAMWLGGLFTYTPNENTHRGLIPTFKSNYSAYLPANKNAKILDFGCGFGDFVKYLHETENFRDVVGFDPDPQTYSALKKYSAFSAETGNPLQFLKENRGAFDLIVCRHSAYYFEREKLAEYFQALSQALKPQGRLIIEVFNGASFSASWVFNNDPYIKLVFTEDLLKNLCQQNQFKVLNLSGTVHTVNGFKGLIWKFLGKVLAKVLKAIYILERGMDPRNPTIFNKNLFLVAEKV